MLQFDVQAQAGTGTVRVDAVRGVRPGGMLVNSTAPVLPRDSAGATAAAAQR